MSSETSKSELEKEIDYHTIAFHRIFKSTTLGHQHQIVTLLSKLHARFQEKLTSSCLTRPSTEIECNDLNSSTARHSAHSHIQTSIRRSDDEASSEIRASFANSPLERLVDHVRVETTRPTSPALVEENTSINPSAAPEVTGARAHKRPRTDHPRSVPDLDAEFHEHVVGIDCARSLTGPVELSIVAATPIGDQLQEEALMETHHGQRPNRKRRVSSSSASATISRAHSQKNPLEDSQEISPTTPVQSISNIPTTAVDGDTVSTPCDDAPSSAQPPKSDKTKGAQLKTIRYSLTEQINQEMLAKARDQYYNLLLNTTVPVRVNNKVQQRPFKEKEAAELTNVFFDEMLGSSSLNRVKRLVHEYNSPDTDGISHHNLVRADHAVHDPDMPQLFKDFFDAFRQDVRSRKPRDGCVLALQGLMATSELCGRYEAIMADINKSSRAHSDGTDLGKDTSTKAKSSEDESRKGSTLEVASRTEKEEGLGKEKAEEEEESLIISQLRKAGYELKTGTGYKTLARRYLCDTLGIKEKALKAALEPSTVMSALVTKFGRGILIVLPPSFLSRTRTLPGWGFTKVAAAVELLHQVLPTLPHLTSHLERLIYNPIQKGIPIQINSDRLCSKSPFLEVLQDACTNNAESRATSAERCSSRAQTVASEG